MMQQEFIHAAEMIADQKKKAINQKYEGLRKNYNELLTSFDQSEELRKVYKQLVIDQRDEINRMKQQLNGQDEQGYRSLSPVAKDYREANSIRYDRPINSQQRLYNQYPLKGQTLEPRERRSGDGGRAGGSSSLLGVGINLTTPNQRAMAPSSGNNYRSNQPLNDSRFNGAYKDNRY